MATFEELANQLQSFAQARDFEGAFAFVRENRPEIAARFEPAVVRDALKKTTDDRLLLSFIDACGLGQQPFDKALIALEKLVSLQVGALVLSKAWGLGKVKRLDYFYRRITVDFKTRKGHQFSYAAAVDMLESAPDNHILVLREADPTAFDDLLKNHPGEFVKAVLRSYGDMTAVKLEEVCTANGFVKAVHWKKFWDDARAELRSDDRVSMPSRRADPVQLREQAEDYGDGWLLKLQHETDPKLILASVREFVAQKKMDGADAGVKAVIGERLAFAVTAARKVDDALYARLACEVTALGFAEPTADEMRGYLWERRRFVKAAAELPAREVGAMIDFLAANDELRAKVYAELPNLCFAAVTEIVTKYGRLDACRAAVASLMKQPKAPATLTTLIAGKYENFRDWPVATDEFKAGMPPLITILAHAIALGEGRQSGETLKMQNIVRRLFADKKWLEKIFSWLSPADQVVLFERFQASIAWDPSTHHAIVVRMTHLAPALQAHFVRAEKKHEYARITSRRSFAERKAEYLKLINVDMPENVRKIEFAKGFGDLSENAEYQYAKDEQRQLMQKQTLMQADLEAVKPDDFANVALDEVAPGVTVDIDTPQGVKTYHILGEWDNDVELGVLSSKAKLAANMLGKKPGERFELPSAEGQVEFGTIKTIRELPAEIRAWMEPPAGMAV